MGRRMLANVCALVTFLTAETGQRQLKRERMLAHSFRGFEFVMVEFTVAEHGWRLGNREGDWKQAYVRILRGSSPGVYT